MKKLLCIILLLSGCATSPNQKFVQWEKDYEAGKISYYELEQLKMQESQRRATIVAGAVRSYR